MGADCCGGKKPLPPAEAVRDSCEDSPVTECNRNIDCCTPNNEKCNGKDLTGKYQYSRLLLIVSYGSEECLLSVAATLCAEGVGGHTDGHHGCTSTLRTAQSPFDASAANVSQVVPQNVPIS